MEAGPTLRASSPEKRLESMRTESFAGADWPTATIDASAMTAEKNLFMGGPFLVCRLRWRGGFFLGHLEQRISYPRGIYFDLLYTDLLRVRVPLRSRLVVTRKLHA